MKNTFLESSTLDLIEAFGRYVVPTYARFPLAFVRGKGTRLWDAEGKSYLDFGSGIAVNTLGHSHPMIAKAIAQQAETLVHTSNLYHTPGQALLAERLVKLMGDGKCFFCNSGAEANEALFKLARKFGHDSGRYEILTTLQSFHGRTLAGIAATGQEKVKKGFEPPVEGFRHVPFNDLEAMRNAIGDKTAAILIEGIQGESGIHPATADYLLGLRKLCDERNLLFLMDSVQCGMFRTGRFQSYQRILEDPPHAPRPTLDETPETPHASRLTPHEIAQEPETENLQPTTHNPQPTTHNPQPTTHNPQPFLPDAISMAKGIAGGLPMGVVWIRQPYQDLLGAGAHGTTFGGTPLVCSAALAVLDVVEKDRLADNARKLGEFLQTAIHNIKSPYITEVRGLGLMIGIELKTHIPALAVEGKTPASLFVSRLHEQGLLTIPSGNQTIRLLPPLNVSLAECEEAVEKLKKGLEELNEKSC